MKKSLSISLFMLIFTGLFLTKCTNVSRTASKSYDQFDCFSPSELDMLENHITESLRFAERDKTQFGVTGAYASAPNDNVRMLKEILGEVHNIINHLKKPSNGGDKNPNKIIFSEASWVYDSMNKISKKMGSAAHWARISTVYHKSADAQKSFQITMIAFQQVVKIMDMAGNCYMWPYMNNPHVPEELPQKTNNQ